MNYEDELELLRVELENEVMSLTLALAKSREDNDELVEENARLVAENQAVGHENTILGQQLDAMRGPY
jgi:regulator of replication initiation timing